MRFWKPFAPLLASSALLCACDDPKPNPAEPACVEGQRGCACDAEGACEEGLRCINALCIPTEVDADMGAPDADMLDMSDPDMDPPDMSDAGEPDMDDPDVVDPPVEGSGLRVSLVQARGCEVVLRDPGLRIEAVRFVDPLQGRWMRRGDRLAIAFTSQGTVTPGAASFALAPGASDLDGVDVVVGQCVGADGAPLPDASVTLWQAP